jgi:hypothetical protein
MGEMGLGLGLILRALGEDVAGTHVELVQVSYSSMGEGGDSEVLDAMYGVRRNGKSCSRFGCKDVIGVDCMNRWVRFPVATTAAKGFPDSNETG